jgi:hypothetical protein
MDERMDDITVKLGTLTDALLSLTNIVERHDDQIAVLIEHSKETDARLNALIAVVEARFSRPGTNDSDRV